MREGPQSVFGRVDGPESLTGGNRENGGKRERRRCVVRSLLQDRFWAELYIVLARQLAQCLAVVYSEVQEEFWRESRSALSQALRPCQRGKV